MRKLIIPLLCLLLAAACEKAPLQTITLTVGVESGELKSAAAAVSSINPGSNVAFTLVSTSNTARRYTIEAGASASVPVDSYRVTATYKPSSLYATLYSGTAYAEPSYYVDARITVEEGVSSYSVPAVYSCFAVVIDTQVCSRYSVRDYQGKDMDLFGWVMQDNYGVLFLKVDIGTNIFPLNAYPVDTANYEMKNYPLTFTGTGTQVENGKWYLFSPEGVAKMEGSFSTLLPAWEEGSL